VFGSDWGRSPIGLCSQGYWIGKFDLLSVVLMKWAGGALFSGAHRGCRVHEKAVRLLPPGFGSMDKDVQSLV
jgi:hypothetical protein